MKILALVKAEFLKHYTVKKLLLFTILLLIAVIGLVELSYFFTTGKYMYSYDASGSWFETQYDELSKKEHLTLEEQYDLYSAKVGIPIYDYFEENHVLNRDWRIEIALKMQDLINQNYAITLFLDNRNDEAITSICKLNKTYYENHFESVINHICEIDDVTGLYQENQKLISQYRYLLEQDQFYLYVQYLMDSGYLFEDDIELVKVIVSQKVEDMEDFRALNYMQSQELPIINSSDDLCRENAFANSGYKGSFADCVSYNRYYRKLKDDTEKQKAILLYSTEHHIPHDLVYDKTTFYGSQIYDYWTSKSAVNLIFHLSLVVLLLVAITSSGIVSKEHSSGTIKNLITAPVKRWKILLSKFIYLILHMYILWFIALILLSLYAGFRYGFGDLISPKLVYFNGKVIEINYHLYLLKDMFLASIPMIGFLSILFFLSTVTLHTSLTTSVMTVCCILPVIFYYLCNNFNHIFLFLTKTPFMYFDYGFIFGKSEFYTNILKYTDMNFNYGIVLSVVMILILYLVSTFVYHRRDIQNR